MRRQKQPSIDPARVQPGTRWVKNRAEDQGREQIHVIVDEIETLTNGPFEHHIVHYHNEATGRKGKMPRESFCSGSEHREPDPPPVPEVPIMPEAEEPPPPPSGERETPEPMPASVDVQEDLINIWRKLSEIDDRTREIIAILKAKGVLPTPPFSIGAFA